MISDAYFTVGEYRQAMTKDTDEDDLALARQAISVSRFLDRECGQFFGRDDTPVVRQFVPRFSDVLHLDYADLCPGIATTVGLTVRSDDDGDGVCETPWQATDYRLEPLNAAAGPEPKPYSCIRAVGRRFPVGRLVEVEACFGWPSVPNAIKDEAIELCGIWRGESARAGSLQELDQTVANSPMAMSLVKRVKNAYLAMVGL